MQFKLKAVALALSIGFAGGVQAGIDNFSTQNGELFFTIFDPVNQVSYTRDLEALSTAPSMGTFNMNDFLPAATSAQLIKNNITAVPAVPPAQAPGTVEAPGTTFTWGISTSGPGGGTDTAWQSFLQNSGAASNWRWGVYAGDRIGSAGSIHTLRYLSTGSTLDDVALTNSSTGVGQLSITEGHIDYANSQTAAADGSFYGTAAADGLAGFSGTAFGNDWQGKVPFTATGAVGSSLNFFYLTGRPQQFAPTAQFGNANGASTWTFAAAGGSGAYTLTYLAAPVPEAETWAMFAAGLLGVGAIARRRLSA